jgi:predicted aspartyl protease
VPVKVLAYEARATSTDTDHLTYEVTTASGTETTYHVTLNIKEVPKATPESNSH